MYTTSLRCDSLCCRGLEAARPISQTPLQFGGPVRSSLGPADRPTQTSKVEATDVGGGHAEGAQVSWEETTSDTSRAAVSGVQCL